MEAAKQLKICRLCATDGPNFRAIYNEQNEKNEIGEKISKCLPILISSDDELPGHICPMCLRSLNTSYKLLMKVIETDGKLRQQLSQTRINKNRQDCEPTSHNAAGEAEKNEAETCGFYEINFVDTGAFASNMGTVHQSLLVCNLCHNSFDNAAELRQHKHKTHDNIDNPGKEDCHDSAVVEIEDEGTLVSQDSSIESPASKKTIGKTVPEKIDDITEEDDVVSVDSATSNYSLPDAKAFGVRGEKKFACKHCPRKFLRIRHYEDHQNTHSRKEPYSCVTCPKRFRTYAARWIHEQSHKEKREYICDLCQRSYKYKRFLKRHMLNHLPPEEWDFECEICKFKFKRSTYLKQHMRVHFEDHPYKCDICGAAYGRERDMARHRKRHLDAETHKKKKKQSSQLNDKDKRIQKLKSDKASDDIAKSQPIICSLCGMNFSDADAFSSHMETIHQSKWVCILCESSFATSDELVQHKRKTHSDINDADGKDCQDFGAIKMKEERRSISEDCEEPASLTEQQPSQKLEGSHLVEDQDAGVLEVKKERTSVSEDCEKPASLADQQPSRNLRKRKFVENHQNVQNFQLIPQSSEGQYSCETCHRKFKTLAARSGHQRIHGRVHHHYYTCDYCLKKFTRRCSLVRHIMGHLGPADGLYKCEVCGSSFKGISQLKNHMKVHTEKRIHECDVCGIRFRRKHDMLRHRSCHRDKEINRKQQQQLSQSNDDDDQQNSEQRSQDSSDEAEKGESLMCGLSEISFVDVSTFDSPNETYHQSKWACNLCQNSFATSEELRQHKYKSHRDNIDDAGRDEYKDFVALDDETLESQHSESKPPTPKEKTLEKVPDKDEEVVEEGISNVNCDICCFSIDKAFMPEHKKIHEPFKVLCSTCRMKFTTAYDFIKHNREVHHRFKNTCIRFFCRNCNRSLSTPEALKEHHKVCEPRAPCKYCDQIFNESEIKQHVKKEHPDTILKNVEVVELQCPQCKVVFTDKKLFMDHTHEPSEEVDTKPSIYRCDLCPKTSGSLPSILLHRKWHENHRCPECNGKFETSRAFSRHVQQVHKIKMTSHETAPILRPRKLRERRIINPEQDLYACDSCDKKFKTSAARLSHQRAHGIPTQYTNYTCDYCQRNFRYKSTLIRHIRCHMPRETWKFECTVCTRKFSREFNLKSHMRLHSNGDAHDCDICGARYRRRSDMLQHRHYHDNVKINSKKRQQLSRSCVKEDPEDCEPESDNSIDVETIEPLCEISFVDAGAFAGPIEAPHQSKWECNLCSNSFATSDELVQHKEKTHTDNIDNSGVIEIKEEVISESQDSHVEPLDLKEPIKTANPEKIVHKNRRSMPNNGCIVCHASVDEAFMPEHKKMHEPFEVYCETCQSQFPTAYDLVKHKRDAHNMFTKSVIRFFCRNCNRGLTNIKAFEAHVSFCKLRNKCKFCDKAFNSPDLLDAHQKKEHGERIKGVDKLQCPQCNEVFTDKKLFMSHSHESSVKKEEKYECIQCNKFFPSSVSLRAHCEVHRKPTQYQCKLCPDSFYSLTTLEVHMKRHQNRTCSKCNQVFNNLYALSAHLKEVHSVTFPKTNSERSFVCSYCPQRFRVKYRLEQHLNIHTRKHLHACTLCDRKFNFRRSLLRHMHVHLPRENWIFECDLCKLKFKSRDHLKKHMGIHSRNYAWKCDICGAAYLRECNLVRHKLCHSENAEADEGQREQSSPLLDDDQQNSGLRSDDSSGEIKETEPVCGFCEITFADVSTFDSHMERLHQSKWVCNLCQNSFATSDELLQHKHKTHYDNVDDAVEECGDSAAIEVKEETISVPEHPDPPPPVPKKSKRKTSEKKTLPQSEWICDQCQKSFSASEQLLQHIVEVHCSSIDGTGEEECHDSKPIEIKEEIILVSEHSDTESISVEEPRREVSTSKQIEEEVEAEEVIVDCTICHVPVERYFMPEHQKIHEPFELFCTKCHCKFPTAYDLIKHKRDTHFLFNGTIIRFYCRNCNRSISDSETLKAHEKCVKAQYNCKYCSETFNWLQQLRLHLHHVHHERMLEDKEVKIFECNRCGKVYTDRRRFRLHTAVHRARDKGRYRCKQCNVYYSKAMDLDDHRKTVHKNVRS